MQFGSLIAFATSTINVNMESVGFSFSVQGGFRLPGTALALCLIFIFSISPTSYRHGARSICSTSMLPLDQYLILQLLPYVLASLRTPFILKPAN